ncbi:hypothetical protein [Syntrophorhabdus aromaticivorans]|uniref:hypothetical protein n=1 Tax=Syntrophorhabdus aromaticivorans TaxID=328301 RepID=UPI000428540C|nr:hypothetical protein [Syntrophorhabdus aromaticivorans]
MHNKTKLFVVCMIAAVALLAAAGGWAAMVCTTVGEGADEATIAVAANFTEPLKDLIAACQSTGNPCSDTKYTVCADATANLKAAIDANPNTYGYFFAADTTAKVYGSDRAYEYAKGIPVFFGKKASPLNDARDLVTQAGAVYHWNCNSSDVSSLSFSTNAYDTANSKYMAVAGTAAPYGRMSHVIINDIDGASLPTTIPAYVRDPLYVNVNNVLNAVDGETDRSGWLSKAQICNGSGNVNTGSYVAVSFSDSKFALHQWAIQLDTSGAASTALHYYIKTTLACPSGTGWTNFLNNHCYETP